MTSMARDGHGGDDVTAGVAARVPRRAHDMGVVLPRSVAQPSSATRASSASSDSRSAKVVSSVSLEDDVRQAGDLVPDRQEGEIERFPTALAWIETAHPTREGSFTASKAGLSALSR